MNVDKWREMQKAVHATAQEKGWWDSARSDGEVFALIHSEVSECLEFLRNGNPPDDHCPELPGAIVELADTIIRCMDYAEYRAWDLGKAVYDVSTGIDFRNLDDGECIAALHSDVSVAYDAQDVFLMAELCVDVMGFAQSRMWDIWCAIIVKSEYNKTRARKHGGKKF